MAHETNPPTSNPPETAREHEVKQLLDLLKRALKSDESAVPALQDLLRSPRGGFLVEDFGNLMKTAADALVQTCSGNNLLVREALHAKLEALRAELAGPEPSLLEKLLAERVALCWLHTGHADFCSALVREATIAQRDFYQRQQDHAQARYLASLKALVTVRKLLRPSLSPLDLATRPLPETPAAAADARRARSFFS